MTGNISCIFKFRVLLWGIEALKADDGKSESLSETQEGTEGSRRSHVDAVWSVLFVLGSRYAG